MNEGYLGKFSFGGERAATDDHPAVFHALPLAASVTAKLDVGTLLKRVDVAGSDPADVAYAPFLSTDTEAAPCAVVDKPCDPTGDNGEKSAIAVVHGTVKPACSKQATAKAPPGHSLPDWRNAAFLPFNTRE